MTVKDWQNQFDIVQFASACQEAGDPRAGLEKIAGRIIESHLQELEADINRDKERELYRRYGSS